MKQLQIGDLNVKICEHQGDINYLRFVRFKQWIIQIWEKMDVPSFAFYFEKFMDLHNQSKYAQSVTVWYDFKLAIEQKTNSDAWGVCFALISLLDGEDPRSCPDDSELKIKIDRLIKEGLTAGIVKEEVVNFMKASPEEFGVLMVTYGIPFLPREIESSSESLTDTLQ